MKFHHHHRHNNNAVGVGILAFAVGAIAGMFLAPKSGKQSRAELASWATNMSEDLDKRLKTTKDMTMEKYNETVDEVAYKYRKLNGIKQVELDDFVLDLKERWERIKSEWKSQDKK
jgi:gas vesicle protein